jgi:aldehyde:ferredoxin oxidoreductase
MLSANSNGYNGRLLRINLSTGFIQSEEINSKVCRMFLGGAGFINYYLWKELQPGVDALSPENKLIFALGPVTGLILPGSSRMCIGAKSPLTGGITKSEVGGNWAAELKRAGYDVVIIEGKSPTPVYLFIQDSTASLSDAVKLWGLRIKETEQSIKKELADEHVQITSIGPAGEHQVRFACIMSGLFDAAGRGGLGAVMGSKNLKAIAVRGHHLPLIANPDQLKFIRQQIIAQPNPLSEYGTGGPWVLAEEQMGNLPVHNFRDGLFPEIKNINGIVIKETIGKGMTGCFACPIRCKKVVKVEGQYQIDSDYGAPEYEALAALGSNCCIGNLRAIVKGNEICNSYSMDVISAGSSISFAIECFERGLINTDDSGGVVLKFGDEDLMLRLLEMIALRKGIGNFLAEGTARMSQKIGQGSRDFAMSVKGLEAAMHDPRVRPSLGLGHMVNPHGPDHCSAVFDDWFANEMGIKNLHPLGILEPLDINDMGPKKVVLFKYEQLKSVLKDSMVICVFPEYTYEMLTDLIKAVTGWDTGLPELLKISERTLTLARIFNLREGLSSIDDILPERFLQPKTNGVLADKKFDPDKLIKARKYYYTLMGWDSEGVPLPEKLEELGLT